ncbi:MAG: zinc-binding dehydrogenase [Chloroflexi bacterium]|nr:zinc-binding dehydrogenase [Chloroflexota bacterium]
MMTRTQAVVIPEAGVVELREVGLCEPGPDDVTIQTVYTSISAGTERMLLAGQMPHPMLQLPVIPGYETVGKVIAHGENLSDDWLGRWVYVGGAMCYEGINAAWGGQSATIITPAERVIHLKHIEPVQGVLLALSATALHGIDLLQVQPGQRMLVIGQGPVGQIAARLARGRGAWVAVSDRSASRLERAEADRLINVEAGETLAEAISEPLDFIVEASGSMAALSDALMKLKTGGTILLLGYYQTLELPYMPLFLKEARLLTAKEWGPDDLQRSRDLIASGDLAVSALLTHRLPISAVDVAYKIALNEMDCLKLILEWGDPKHDS